MASKNPLRCWTVRVLSLSVLALTLNTAYADTLSAQTIEGGGDDVGDSSDITVISQQAVIAYYNATDNDLKLFYDDGDGGGTAGDGQVNGSEIRTVDNSVSADPQPAVGANNGTVAVAYYDNSSLNLWVDDGRSGGTARDFVADPGEFRVIDSLGNVGQEPSLTYRGSRLAVSYYDVTNTALKLWFDDGNGGGTADDGQANGTEIRTIDDTNMAGLYNSITVWNNHLVVAYHIDSANDFLFLWIDDGNGTGTANNITPEPDEIRTVDAGGTIGLYVDVQVVNGRLAVVYYDQTNTNLKLWYDDGLLGGTADNGIVDGGEERDLDNSGSVGQFCSLTAINGVLAVSYYDDDTDDLLVWRDDARGAGDASNGAIDGTEVRDGDTGGDVGRATAITVNGGDVLVSYRDESNTALKLLTATLSADPNAPANLTLASCSEGDTNTDKTPTFSFNLDDLDPNDQFSYRIQIDDTDNTFSSLVTDYTSVNTLSRGTHSFTVGQAAGSGTYTVGAANQELPVDTYFWRVRSNDGGADSAWKEGTSFSIVEPTVEVGSTTATTSEAVTTIQATAILSAASCQTVTVDYATANGSATAGQDYTAVSDTLSFAPGETSKNISITILNDDLNEADETFTLTISNPTESSLGTDQILTVTITDDDTPAVSIIQSFNTTIVQEGVFTDSYTVALTSEPTGTVTMTVQPIGEIDLGAGVSQAITLTFDPSNWETPQTVTVTAVDDSEIESEETATITHSVSSSDPDYNNFSVVDVSVSIRDNDSSTNTDTDDTDSDGQDETPASLLPTLALDASGPGSNVTLGELLRFILTLTNNGGITANETRIEVPVPEGLSFSEATLADGSAATVSAANGVLTITLGDLGVLQTETVTIAFSTSVAGSFRVETTAIAANATEQVESVSGDVLVIDPPADSGTTTTPVAPCFLFGFVSLALLLMGTWRYAR